MGVAGSCGLVSWGGGGLGREVVEGAARSPWAPRSVRGGRLRAGGWASGWERPGLGGGLGEKRLPSFAQGVLVGARARTCVHCGGQGAGRSPWCAAACARRGPPPPASRERRWAGDIHLYPHPGRCSICLATVPGCCAQEGRGLVPWRTSRGTGPWCARPSTWRAAGARTRQGETIHPAPDPRPPGTPPAQQSKGTQPQPGNNNSRPHQTPRPRTPTTQDDVAPGGRSAQPPGPERLEAAGHPATPEQRPATRAPTTQPHNHVRTRAAHPNHAPLHATTPPQTTTAA